MIRWVLTCLMAGLAVLYLIDVAVLSSVLVDAPRESTSWFYSSMALSLYLNAAIAGMVLYVSATGKAWRSKIWLLLAACSVMCIAYVYLAGVWFGGLDSLKLNDAFRGALRFGFPLAATIALIAILPSGAKSLRCIR